MLQAIKEKAAAYWAVASGLIIGLLYLLLTRAQRREGELEGQLTQQKLEAQTEALETKATDDGVRDEKANTDYRTLERTNANLLKRLGIGR